MQYLSVPQLARHRRQRVQLIKLRGRGQHQQEHDVDWLGIDGSEVDRLFEADQEPKGPRHLTKACVWNANTTADARGAEFITFLDLIGDRFGR